MLDREAQERLGALLVIGFGPAVVVGLAALGCVQLRDPVLGATGDQPPQLRPALLDQYPHRIPQRVQPGAVREPIELRALGRTQLLARLPAAVQLPERRSEDLLRVLHLGLVIQDLAHQLERVKLPAGREHVLSELHAPGRIGGCTERRVKQVGGSVVVLVEGAGDLGCERQRGDAPGSEPLHLRRHDPCPLFGSIASQPEREAGRRGQILELLGHQCCNPLRRRLRRERLLVAPLGLGEGELRLALHLDLSRRARRRGCPPRRMPAGSPLTLLPLALGLRHARPRRRR